MNFITIYSCFYTQKQTYVIIILTLNTQKGTSYTRNIRTMGKQKSKNEIEEIQGEEMTVTLELDNGDSVTCAVVTIFEVNGKDYIALMPLDENGENTDGTVWFYGYEEDMSDSNKEPILSYIEDDNEFELVEDAFDEYLDSCEYDELLDENETSEQFTID